MHNHQTLYHLLLILSGVGGLFALLAMFTSLLFPLCAVVTVLCYLVGAAIVLFVIPKRYRQEDKKKRLPLQVRAINVAFWTAAVLTVFILPYVGLVRTRMRYAEILVALSYVFTWVFLLTQVRKAKEKKED